ncbi:MAG TPA: multiheme c-type cytochrome [Stellaceae bacterium]|nr:multiheme c-type cytochrome [Stellaceae bacterium]
MQQNEYFIWSQKDKHSKAYAVLSDPRSLRIAKNLGLADAQHATLCLDCHTDNVPVDRRGPQFQLSDGIGCEACHGGALPWLGTHIQGVTHQANLAAGMYPMDQPLARAERCLSCHVGSDKKFVTHKMMGAGHPPMPFELDTYTAIEPAHFTVTPSYVERKGRPNDMQFWAVGQAVDVKQRMDLILDQKQAPKGVDFELSLFDCQSCHHSMSDLQWEARASSGLPPGRIKLYDATAMMLRVAAERVAPDTAKALRDHILALHAAAGDSWDAVKREASAVRDAANALIPQFVAHEFNKDDARAMADAVIATALEDHDFDYSGAQQQVMALESIVTAMKSLGLADETQISGLNQALDGLYAAVADDQKYSPDAYAEALKAFKAKL